MTRAQKADNSKTIGVNEDGNVNIAKLDLFRHDIEGREAGWMSGLLPFQPDKGVSESYYTEELVSGCC